MKSDDVRGTFSADALAGRRALVTGAGSGIGRAIAIAFSACGADVVASDIDPESAGATADSCSTFGGRVDHVGLDVTSPSSVRGAFDRLSEAGVIDVVVNNAGVVHLNSVVDMSDAEFDRVVAVSLKGTYLVSRAALPRMRSARSGRIVSISSILGKTPAPALAHYSAAKAGVIALTQTIALEAAPDITANCICPGQIDTSMIEADVAFARRTNPEVTADEVMERLTADIPAGRFGSPFEVAAAAVFLASGVSAFVTGQVITVAGGQELH